MLKIEVFAHVVAFLVLIRRVLMHVGAFFVPAYAVLVSTRRLLMRN